MKNEGTSFLALNKPTHKGEGAVYKNHSTEADCGMTIMDVRENGNTTCFTISNGEIFTNMSIDGYNPGSRHIAYAPQSNSVLGIGFGNGDSTQVFGELFKTASIVVVSLWNGDQSNGSILYNPTMVPMLHWVVGATISVEHGDNWAQFIRISENEVRIVSSSTNIYGYLCAYA